MYPKLLVFLQFGLITLMLYFSKGFQHFLQHTFALPLFVMGLSFGLWALNHNRLGNFHVRPKLKENAQLITTGIYKFIRHPMYTSVILMMFAVLMSSPTLTETVLFISLLIILVLKARKEESLWVIHNSSYEKYRKQTKLFIPYIL
jgi:protein-S-isoprenylcysteine O-methyltransferase Ste14